MRGAAAQHGGGGGAGRVCGALPQDILLGGYSKPLSVHLCVSMSGYQSLSSFVLLSVRHYVV